MGNSCLDGQFAAHYGKKIYGLAGDFSKRKRRPKGGAFLEDVDLLTPSFHRLYLHSTLKSSKNTVTVPLALKVKCAVSLTRKLFPGPAPIIRKRFMNVSFA